MGKTPCDSLRITLPFTRACKIRRRDLVSSMVEISPVTGGCLRAPTQTHPLFSIPFRVATDFTTLSSHCDRFADTLIESDDPTLKMALCGRLVASLMLLRTTLNDPVPPQIKERLTVDTFPPHRLVLNPIQNNFAITALHWHNF